ncbi:DUF2919 domain-containing protein [Aeromonas caviae]|uniref:DUF2919 domain-containing protein n=1 Tax=Aeromonas caviae TaxID=648 RepID=UPI0029D87211|nr:DUF2919 domain-containing protein [Aeromonas caviae]MDX7787634.1 DUF2919 domain-containing protein [Aeromonas caviae]
MTLYPEHRYDDHGQLRPPLWFWPIALLLTRSVWLFLMAGVTRESGSAILTLFYPDKLTLYVSLLTDVPAMLALLACGGTHRQTHSARAWLRRHSRALLLCSTASGLVMQLHSLNLQQWSFNWPTALVLIASLWALWYLLRSRQLRDYALDQSH